MSTPSSEFGHAAWIVDLLRLIGDVERRSLSVRSPCSKNFLAERTLTESDEQAIAAIVNRTCAAVRSGRAFAPSETEESSLLCAAGAGELLAALHRNGKEVDPEVLRKLEAHRQRIREQKR